MNPEGNLKQRGQWSSRFGFVLAAAGSAIGLGNIWRFPYTTGQNGGGAFVFLYLICILLIGLPVMIAELTIGRHSRKDAVGAFEVIRPGSPWKIIGYMGVITGVCILSYYSVLAGYTVGYIGKSLAGNISSYESFTSNAMIAIPLFILFIALTCIVVQGGVRGGIEKWSRILMPVLFILMVILIIRSVTLEGAGKGLSFYLKPDFSKITGKTFLAALGQAFFSLSLGMGAMITYGSYIKKEDNLVVSGCYVAFFDTLIAFMAGLLIFPAIFAMNMDPTVGTGLVFTVLPEIFRLIPGGMIVGAFFFILLAIAALTSTISLLEVVTAYLVDEKHWMRSKTVWIVGGITFVVGFPSLLSQEGMVPWLADLPLVHTSFLGLMDWLFGNVMLGVGALFISIFVGWVWKNSDSTKEILNGYPGFERIAPILYFLLKFISPVLILIVLFFLFRSGV